MNKLIRRKIFKKASIIRRFSSFFSPKLVIPSSNASGPALYKHQINKNASEGIFTLSEKPLPLHGPIHLGHIYNNLYKDIIMRYKVLSGYQVRYQMGFSCFTSEIELEAMKEALSSNQGIYKDYKDHEIRKICEIYLKNNFKTYVKQIDGLNIMADINRSWFTIAPMYQAKILKIFNNLLKEGLIYRDFDRCLYSFNIRKEVNLADIETKNMNFKANFIKMRVIDYGNDKSLKERCPNLYILTFVKELWEIPGIQAVGINKQLIYVLIKNPKNEENLLISKKFLEKNQTFLENEGYMALMEIGGTALLSKGLKLQNFTHLFENPLPITQIIDNKSLGTDIFAIVPSHDFKDYEYANELNIKKKGFIMKNGKFNEEMPTWLAGKDVFSKETNVNLEEFIDKSGFSLKGIDLTINSHIYIDKKFNDRVIYISIEKWYMKNFLKELNKIPNIMDKTNMFSAILAKTYQIPISKKGVWGIPVPVFYNKKDNKLLIKPEIIEFLQEKFAREGSDIWYSTNNIKDLLPEKFHMISNDLIRSEEIFESLWVDACSNIINLNECTLETIEKKDNTVQKQANLDISLLIEGNDQINQYLLHLLIVTSCHFKTIITRSIKLHNLLQDPETKIESVQPAKLSKMSNDLDQYKLDDIKDFINKVLNKLASGKIEGTSFSQFLMKTDSLSKEENEGYNSITLDILRYWVISQEKPLKSIEISGNFDKNLFKTLSKLTHTITLCYMTMLEELLKNRENNELFMHYDPNKLSFMSKFILDKLYIFLYNCKFSYENHMLYNLYETINNFFIVNLYGIYMKSTNLKENERNMNIYELTSIVISPIFLQLSSIVYQQIPKTYGKLINEVSLCKWPRFCLKNIRKIVINT